MNRKLIITEYKDGIASALFADRKAVELSFEKKDSGSLLGNIYIGKIVNIAKNIQAAFVEIEDRAPCYLSLEDNPELLYTSRKTGSRPVVGDELLVQVSREGIKTKAPTVTGNISLPGKYLVLTAAKKQIGVSAKITGKQRERLLQIVRPLADDRFGWIVRTNAAEASEETLQAEATALSRRYFDLLFHAGHRPCRSCLYRAPAVWMRRILDLYDTDYEQILTDNEYIYGQLREYLTAEIPAAVEKLEFYHDRLLPLAKLYPVENAFEEALRERVWLKSGAYLVIQGTEALTAIDVNTGKCERGKNQQETFFRINTEAAHEIARQLRLRNLSGMILIDFINMDSPEQKRLLMELLDKELKKDPVKACVVDMTKLGLVEVTRKRIQKPLIETLNKNEFLQNC